MSDKLVNIALKSSSSPSCIYNSIKDGKRPSSLQRWSITVLVGTFMGQFCITTRETSGLDILKHTQLAKSPADCREWATVGFYFYALVYLKYFFVEMLGLKFWTNVGLAGQVPRPQSALTEKSNAVPRDQRPPPHAVSYTKACFVKFVLQRDFVKCDGVNCSLSARMSKALIPGAQNIVVCTDV